MRKYVLVVTLCIAMACNVCACGKNENVSEIDKRETVQVPTGYPEGEAQEICIMYKDNLYVYDGLGRMTVKEEDVTKNFTDYTEKQSLISDSDNKEPTENLHAAHIHEGSSVYINPDNTVDVVVYDKADGDAFKLKIK